MHFPFAVAFGGLLGWEFFWECGVSIAMRGVGEGFVQRCWFSGRVFSSCSECLLLKVSVSFSEQILNSQMDCQISSQTLKTTKRMLTTQQPPPKRHLPKRHPLNSHSRIGAMAQICSLNIALGAFYAAAILASSGVSFTL